MRCHCQSAALVGDCLDMQFFDLPGCGGGTTLQEEARNSARKLSLVVYVVPGCLHPSPGSCASVRRLCPRNPHERWRSGIFVPESAIRDPQTDAYGLAAPNTKPAQIFSQRPRTAHHAALLRAPSTARAWANARFVSFLSLPQYRTLGSHWPASQLGCANTHEDVSARSPRTIRLFVDLRSGIQARVNGQRGAGAYAMRCP